MAVYDFGVNWRREQGVKGRCETTAWKWRREVVNGGLDGGMKGERENDGEDVHKMKA